MRMNRYRTRGFFSGTVQGVGFRWTTKNVADRFRVSGFVRNLPDGRVVLEAEGDRDTVEGFIEALKSRMDSYIRSIESNEEKPTGGETGFEIRF